MAAEWTPPATIEELYASSAIGGTFGAMNRPTAGARTEAELPRGDAPIQLYSLATPNGHRVSILLEELEEEGLLTYDAHKINIGAGDQFTSGFTEVNPNGKIPALVDVNGGSGGKPLHLFESGSICTYLAERYGGSKLLLAHDPALKAEVMNWIFWSIGGQGPITGACFGHFFVYAPGDKVETRNYGIYRYGMEVQRLCDVLNKRLEGRQYLVGDTYSLADIICYPWFRQLQVGYKHSSGIAAGGFIGVEKYKAACEWAERIAARPAVQRGLQVCHWEHEKAKPWK